MKRRFYTVTIITSSNIRLEGGEGNEVGLGLCTIARMNASDMTNIGEKKVPFTLISLLASSLVRSLAHTLSYSLAHSLPH